ncbi:MAG: glycerol-3-phosphate 1-O-acyltransferase PlsY [Acidimicrobiia bacterium]|nr:MAG: glycerol-3-phosphate 1-O-acyltransferase PlsY [Acidimicrobiia bacterium]
MVPYCGAFRDVLKQTTANPVRRLGFVQVLIALVAAYLIGSIDFGVIVPRLLGVNIYQSGSGNPGTSNVLRALGKGPAALVMVGDALKGTVAAAIGGYLGGVGAAWSVDTLAAAGAFAAVLGHILPVWHRFRGGRGVATAIGAVVYLAPLFGLALAAAWLAMTLVGKLASVASLVTMALYVPGLALFGYRGWSLVWAGAIVVVVVARHRANVGRLLRGEERNVAQ